MYVTRPLSWYKRFPAELQKSPSAEGPNSGILVIQDRDEEEDTAPLCCFGLCKANSYRWLTQLPFPQNKEVKIHIDDNPHDLIQLSGHGVFFIPVLDKPLSSNCYYVLQSRGRRKGKAFKSSKMDEHVYGDCLGEKHYPSDKPQPADNRDIYQQFKIDPPRRYSLNFIGKSVASDGVPPDFLRFFEAVTITSNSRNFTLSEARGLDIELRTRLPEFNFPLSCKTSDPVVVGKWYCPFIFIKDGKPKDQMRKSMYYEMTLEQRWEQVLACDNGDNYNEDDAVGVDVKVEREVFRVGGDINEAFRYGSVRVDDGVMWFKSCKKEAGREVDIGLSLAIFERMKWEQERFGWSSDEKREVRIERVEKFGNEGKIWKKFGCYILVERFVLRRMDGSLAFAYDFKHTHQIRSKWE
ncbi:hypothetical protein CCACVL1_16166 [Corchorus capsularis]|uniref:Uncharacterized protein n=1 Tax=Corchorus capsularis TaxID=210143 RepID=A0A1R3HYL5_COCAP|nr:hypothetical protein CCACVL1_16166 [Corchorus capsularis]